MENTIENALNHIADSGIGGEIKHESTGVYRLSFDTEKLAASFVAYADQSCSAKDAEIAELKRRVAELAADRNDLHDRLFKALDMLG